MSMMRTKEPFQKNLQAKLTFLSLCILSVGLMTSISIMSGFHVVVLGAILIGIVPGNLKKLPRSTWALLLLGLAMVVSVLFNWDSYENPSKVLFKTRYLIIGVLAIIPFDFYLNHYLSAEKRASFLKMLLFFCVLAANLAAVSGLMGYLIGYNPLRPGVYSSDRNLGIFGKVMPYAHCVSWLSVFLVNLFVNRNELNLGKWFQSWYLLLSIGISTVSLFATHTRGALLAWLAGCLAINRKIAFFGLVLFALGFVGLSISNKNFATNHILRSGSNQERIGYFLGAYEAFKTRPLLGYGYMNYFSVTQQIKKKHNLPVPDSQGDAHNDLLELLASVGFTGFSFFLVWITTWVFEVSKRSKLEKAFVFPFVIAFLVSGLTQVTLATSECLFFLTTFYVFSVVLGNPEKGTAKPLVTSNNPS